MKLRDKKILTQDEYRKLLREIGPCTVERTDGAEGPVITKLVSLDKWATCHYLVDDLDAYTYKNFLEKLPEPVQEIAPVISCPPFLTYIEGKTFVQPSVTGSESVEFYKGEDYSEKATLETLKASDAGNYKMIAKNKYGESEAYFELSIIKASTLALLDSAWNTGGQLSGNKATYTGNIHYFTRTDGLETYPAGTYLTGNRVGVRVNQTAEVIKQMTQYAGIVRFGGKEWTTRDAFAVSNPEVETPSFSYWPCVDDTNFQTKIIIDWMGNGDPNTTEEFIIQCTDVTLDPASES